MAAVVNVPDFKTNFGRLDDEPDSVGIPEATLPPIIDASEFLAAKVTPPPELICGLLHQGSKLVLGGSSKSYKTWSLLDLAVSVAAGVPFLTFKTTRGQVLFVNLEIQAGFFQQRLRAVALAKGITLAKGQVDVWNLRGFAASYTLLLPRIIEQIQTRQYVLIVLDPIYKLYGNTDENSAGAVAQLLNGIETVTVETGAAVAFGAHYSKGNQAGKSSIDRISGSGVFARDPDSILNFTAHEDEDAFAVEPTLRNFPPVEPFAVRWQFPLMRRDETLDPSKLKKAGGREKEHTADSLLDVLGQNSLTTSEWLKLATEETGMSERTFYSLRKELVATERVLQSKATRQWQQREKVAR